LELAKGTVAFSKFVILDRIGAGGMGAIYKARDDTLNRIVVLKVLNSQFDPAHSLVRFQNEAKALGRLQHSNIATVYDFGVSADGQAYLAMDYVEGQNLREAVESGLQISLSKQLQIFVRLCDAVKHAHSENVIHRDIKPENVMLVTRQDEPLVPVLLDFGVAKLESDGYDSGQKLTKHGSIIGSPLYMSPEQASGLTVTPATDQYSLGCVLFYMLVGRPPFEGESALETLTMHIEDAPPSLREASGKDWPEALEEVVAKLLSKHSYERYDSLDEIADEIKPLMEAALEDEAAKPLSEPDADSFATTIKAKLTPKTVALSGLILAVAAVLSITATGLLKKKDESNLGKGLNSNILPDKQPARVNHIEKLVARNPLNIKLEDNPYQDSDFVSMTKLTRLRTLEIGCCAITDRTMGYLVNAPIHTLKMPVTEVKTLAHIGKFRDLETLELTSTKVTDESLKELVDLPMLSHLGLSDTAISDVGLKGSLSKLANLEELSIKSTRVTAAGVADFQRKLPWCRVRADVETKFDPKLSIVETAKWSHDGHTEEAYERFVEIGKRAEAGWGSPDAPILGKVLWYQGACLQRMKRLDESEKVISQAVAVSRKSGNLRNICLSVSSLSGYVEADRKLKEAIALRTEALAAADHTFRANSDEYFQMLYALVTDLIKVNDVKTRYEYSKNYVLRLKEGSDPISYRYLQALFWQAEAEYQLNKTEEALAHLQELTKLLQKDIGEKKYMQLAPFVYHHLALCLARKNQFEEALTNARVAQTLLLKNGIKEYPFPSELEKVIEDRRKKKLKQAEAN